MKKLFLLTICLLVLSACTNKTESTKLDMDELINHVEDNQVPVKTNVVTYKNETLNFQLTFPPETKFSYQEWQEPNFGIRLCFDEEVEDCETGFGNGDLLEIITSNNDTPTSSTELKWQTTQETDSHSSYTIYETQNGNLIYKLAFAGFRSNEHIQKVVNAFSFIN